MATTYTLLTWNTQGDFTAAAKLGVITANLGSGRVVGMLQEGGVNKQGKHTWGGGNSYSAYIGNGIGAKNERCTNYVLVDTIYQNFVTKEVITTLDDEVVVGGGVAGRAPAGISLGAVLFVSWHAAASDSANADTAALIDAIDKNEYYYKQFHTVVIGGDFNASPATVATSVTSGTKRTKAKWNYISRMVVSSGQTTHVGTNGSSELDMFVVMATATPAHSNLGVASRLNVAPSDHYPVKMTIDVT